MVRNLSIIIHRYHRSGSLRILSFCLPSHLRRFPNFATDTCFFDCCSLDMLAGPDGELPDRLRNIEPKLLEHITNEIMERDPMVRWDDIGMSKISLPDYTLPLQSALSLTNLLKRTSMSTLGTCCLLAVLQLDWSMRRSVSRRWSSGLSCVQTSSRAVGLQQRVSYSSDLLWVKSRLFGQLFHLSLPIAPPLRLSFM